MHNHEIGMAAADLAQRRFDIMTPEMRRNIMPSGVDEMARFDSEKAELDAYKASFMEVN